MTRNVQEFYSLDSSGEMQKLESAFVILKEDDKMMLYMPHLHVDDRDMFVANACMILIELAIKLDILDFVEVFMEKECGMVFLDLNAMEADNVEIYFKKKDNA